MSVVLAALALMHLIALHDSAGFRKGIFICYLKLPFALYLLFIDLTTILIIVWLNIFDFFTAIKSSVRSRAACFLLWGPLPTQKIVKFSSSNRKFINSNASVRSYSCTSSVINKPCLPARGQHIQVGSSLNDFYEWFVGFADAESCFHIKKVKQSGFEFEFKISLHIDDLEVLRPLPPRSSAGGGGGGGWGLIKKTLGIGRVDTYGKKASFRVSNHQNLPILFEILDKFTLNSTKYLDYLDFKKGFELYMSSKQKLPSTIELISQIKNGMNSQRTDFSMLKSHQLRITPYWVLGFVEGEGSFSIKRNNNFPLTFSLTQKHNSDLMKAIQNFFISLGVSRNWRNHNDAITVSFDKRISSSAEDISSLFINRVDYITNVLIPFFDSLTWHSKKEKDYKDWKTILKLKKLGLHYVEEGVRVINLILSQMNLKRLSSNESRMSQAQIDALQMDIERLLGGPSNLEIKEDGRIFIKSLNKYYTGSGNIKVELLEKNGLVFNTFDSISDCAKFLGLAPRTVTTRLTKNQPVIVDNKELFVKNVNSE
jgi:hypothetical protein